MSNILGSDDRDICWFPPDSSLGAEADVACSGMAHGSEAAESRSEREVLPFSRGFGLGSPVGQSLRETIGLATLCVGRSFRLSVDVRSDWPLRSPPALGFLETPLGGNGPVSIQVPVKKGG